MGNFNVFIDGEYGLMGSRLKNALEGHPDIRLVYIDPEHRKDSEERYACMREADITVCCLPREASVASMSIVSNSRCRFLDMSSAHIESPRFVYGLPELSENRRKAIGRAQYVSNPGSYATGFISIVRPLVKRRVISNRTVISAVALAGYSEGGKAYIAAHEAGDDSVSDGVFLPGGSRNQLSELLRFSGLSRVPDFYPGIGDFYNGIAVRLQFKLPFLCSAEKVHGVLSEHYAYSSFINVLPFENEAPADLALKSEDCQSQNGTGNMEISVQSGADKTCLITAKYDNLGKGSVLSCIQNLNLMLELDETAGILTPSAI